MSFMQDCHELSQGHIRATPLIFASDVSVEYTIDAFVVRRYRRPVAGWTEGVPAHSSALLGAVSKLSAEGVLGLYGLCRVHTANSSIQTAAMSCLATTGQHVRPFVHPSVCYVCMHARRQVCGASIHAYKLNPVLSGQR